jgi:L-amino acid N-acyltransferase YncA
VGFLTRFAELADAAQICEIYNHEVRSSLNTLDLEERSVDEQVDWINDRSGAHVVLVAVEAQRILGFAATSPYRDRAAYRTTVESSVYVAQGSHGKGIGTALMRDLLLHTTQAGFHSVIARIQSTNAVSRHLHEQLGYRLIGTEIAVGRKFGKWVDMLSYQKMLEAR